LFRFRASSSGGNGSIEPLGKLPLVKFAFEGALERSAIRTGVLHK
jgi:hypothetical protein